MVKEVNPMIHVNERDYPVNGHHEGKPYGFLDPGPPADQG